MAGTDVAAQETMVIGDLPKRAQVLIEHLGIKLSDPEDITWRIAEQVALATTAEELFDSAGPLGLREHLGEKFYIKHVDYLPGKKGKSVFYAVISAVKPDGEAVMYTTGATSVVIQLARGMQLNVFEGKAVWADWSTKEANADGNRPYKLFQA